MVLLAKFVLLGLVSLTIAQDSPCRPSPCGVNTNCQVSGAGAAVCRCQPGYDHAPGSNTIEGCPIRASESTQQVSSSFPRRRPSVSTLDNRLGPTRLAVLRQDPEPHGDPCFPDPCGQNTECRSARNRAVCSCLPRHRGDPYTRCDPDPCEGNPCGINADCIERNMQFTCRCPSGFNGDPYIRCDDDPCNQNPSPCAQNADCQSRGNQAICTCRAGFEGDPFVRCSLNPCHNDPCGINAECQARGEQAICSCQRGYEGDPYRRCTLNPCLDNPCGPNAECNAQGNSARCSCLPGYVGNPASRQGCSLEPCQSGGNGRSGGSGPCGRNAECEARGRSAICRCPRGFTGDPYTSCRSDPCSLEPCGANAICTGSDDRGGYDCTCPDGYVGSGYSGCIFDPCHNNPCGPNTECSVSGDRAICRCRRGFVGNPDTGNGCRADPCSVANSCGINAECRNEVDTRSGGQRPVCHCLTRHVGDPYQQCHQGECISNSECGSHEACQDFQCVDPCRTSCGDGAECEVRDHVAICRCPTRTTGDPFQRCRRFTRDEICQACGANTDCEVDHEDRPTCKCKRNFIGNPLTGCRYECERDFDCSPSQKCSDFRCTAVCDQDACGENANCVARNNRAQCTCPEDFLGDAYSRCYTECTRHNDCSSNQACVRFKCVDPCYVPKQVCGQGADCNVKNHKAICSCPRSFTGDPFVSCRPFTKEDLCSPNPCGPNARCEAGFDSNGGDRPVCTCPSGYRGDPLISCSRGECDNDSDCANDKGCYDFQCEDPCRRGNGFGRSGPACGVSADCRTRNHAAICTCPNGMVGDPLVACRETRRGANTRVVGVNNRRFK